MSVRTLQGYVWQDQFVPDGRAGRRSWWWPASVQAYLRQRRPPGTLSARQVAELLGVPIRQVYRLRGLRPVGRVEHRPWWAVADVLAYAADLPPGDAVRVRDVAEILGVSVSQARNLAVRSLPADGTDVSGRLWWRRERLDELLGPRRLAAATREASGWSGR